MSSAYDARDDMLRPTLLYSLAALCVLATLLPFHKDVLPFHKDETWWVRACDFPRLQIATLTAITLAGILALIEPDVLSSTLALALLGCLGGAARGDPALHPAPAGRGETEPRRRPERAPSA